MDDAQQLDESLHLGRASDVGEELPADNLHTMFTAWELGLPQLEEGVVSSLMGSEDTMRALYPQDPPTTLSPLRTKQTKKELVAFIRSTTVATGDAARELTSRKQ